MRMSSFKLRVKILRDYQTNLFREGHNLGSPRSSRPAPQFDAHPARVLSGDVPPRGHESGRWREDNSTLLKRRSTVSPEGRRDERKNNLSVRNVYNYKSRTVSQSTSKTHHGPHSSQINKFSETDDFSRMGTT